jgi:hypothetical protein
MASLLYKDAFSPGKAGVEPTLSTPLVPVPIDSAHGPGSAQLDPLLSSPQAFQTPEPVQIVSSKNTLFTLKGGLRTALMHRILLAI